MSPHHEQSTGENFALRLKAFYAALFMTLGVQMPFLPIWLTAKGLDAEAVGIVLAVPIVVRIVAIPLATRAADRRQALRGVIVIAAVAATLAFAALGFAHGMLAITMLYALASAAYAPVMMLVDTYALRGLARRGRAYGPVRLWGSAAFIVASFAAGALLSVISPLDVIWLLVATMALTALVGVMLAPLDKDIRDASAAPPPAAQMLREPSFVAVIMAASLIQASHALYYGFSTIDWQSAGFDGAAIGTLWALGVIAEIALFALSARLPATITPIALLLIGATGAVVRWVAMALGPAAAALPVLQLLHALSFGATHLGALGFVARAAPVGMAATAQGYLAVAIGVTMAAAMALSGALYARYGGVAYGAMAAIAFVGGLCALLAKRITERRRTLR